MNRKKLQRETFEERKALAIAKAEQFKLQRERDKLRWIKDNPEKHLKQQKALSDISAVIASMSHAFK